MLDLGPFSTENLDPKKWINLECQTRHPQDSLYKHLVDLEMKLQMVSEEIAASLEEQSATALLRVPRATRDVFRLRDDAVSLRSSISGILQKLKKSEGSSADSIAALAKVDTIKQRMEAAYETLQKSNLRKHLKAVHSEEKPFVCCFPDCGMRFSYKLVRDKHEKSGAHIYSLGDFEEADEQHRSRPRGGRKRKCPTVEMLIRKSYSSQSIGESVTCRGD